MARLLRFWQSPTWRRALQVDGDLAEVEGLAAGTGLLTGSLAHGSQAAPQPCPTCAGPGDVVVIDLVARFVDRRCQQCGHRWTTDEAARSSATG